MPKQILEIKDFSGGLNSQNDTKDLRNNEFSEAKGVMFDKPGLVRMSKRSQQAQNAGTDIANYDSVASEKLINGYGLGYLNSDTIMDSVKFEITPGNADNWTNKYLSLRDGADAGNWGSTNHTVMKVIKFVDNGSDNDFIYCIIIKPGTIGEQYTDNVGTYEIYIADDASGTNSTDQNITLGLSSETLNNTDDFTSNWTIATPTDGSTSRFSVVGSGAGASSYIRYNPSATASDAQSAFFQLESSNAVTWLNNKGYLLKMTFNTSYVPADGLINVYFLGSLTTIAFRNISGTTFEAFVQSGSQTADANIVNNLVFQFFGVSNEVQINTISLKQSTAFQYPSEYLNFDDNQEGEANLVAVSGTDFSIDRFSFFINEWMPVLKYMPAFDFLEQAKMQNLSINSSGVGTLRNSTGGKVLTYQIAGALHFVDTNFLTSHRPNLLANYWLGHIKQKLFPVTSQSHNVDSFVFTLMDIIKPLKGKLHNTNTTTPELNPGYLTMIARPADTDTSLVVWESGADPDGWFAGKSGNSSSAYLHNRGASFPKDLLDTATQRNSDDNLVGAYCASKYFSGQFDNGDAYIVIGYHSDYDYNGESDTVTTPLNYYNENQKIIYFDLYLSEYSYNLLSDSDPSKVWLGSKLPFKDTYTSSNTACLKYTINKIDLEPGWQQVQINLDDYDSILGSPDLDNITKFALELRLSSGSTDFIGEVGTTEQPTYNVGTDINVSGVTVTSSTNTGATAVNHNQIINIGTDVAGAGFTVGDIIFIDFADDGVSAIDEFAVITKINGNAMHVTRPYKDQNIWSVLENPYSGGADPRPHSNSNKVYDQDMKINQVTAVPHPGAAIANISYGEKTDGGWDGEYKFFYTFVYDDNQESQLFEFADTVSATNQSLYFNFWMPQGEGGGFGLASTLGLSGHRINKANIYYSRINSADDVSDQRVFLLGNLDVEKGFKFSNDDKYFAWTEDPNNTGLVCIDVDSSQAGRQDIFSNNPPFVDFYESSAGYSTDVDSVQAHFKDIAFNNGIAYAAYPYQATSNEIDTSEQKAEAYPDRILKSLPNRYDIFPNTNYIDVVTEDGESIVAIETFNDRLLQFKENTLYIINVSKDLEFLEDTFNYLGVQNKNAVSKSDVGIVFANKFGIYVYPGSGEPVNLTAKIDESEYATFAGDGKDLVTIYMPTMDQFVVARTNNSDTKSDSFIVDMQTQTVTRTTDGVDFSQQYGYSNVVLDTENGQPLWISDDNSNTKVFTIDNIDDSTSTVNGHASGKFNLKTKYYDFDRPGVKKKIHKVRVSYKCSATTNVQVKFGVNQEETISKVFADGDNFSSNELSTTGGAFRVAELSPNVSSQSNNVYSFALEFTNDGTVPEDFKINDISIVFRYKNVK